ncbi:antitoxin [uncultured Robinsoniella sp.]|uniref:antitoxin n=1 Tax=Robinsoniella sp. TaxID=2496533 RepID=UPI00374EC10B
MADILRVTAPAVGKNVISPNKAAQDPSIPFDLQEINHVVKNPESSGLLGHHNILKNETGAATLMDLLKDPAVTVNYLKNIYMLEEIINLLPVNNNTVTQEIRQLFRELLINPDQIVEELLKQEYSSTLFKGALFEFLRTMLRESPGLKMEIASLLKAVNGTIAKQDVMDSVANSLEYLAGQMRGNSLLSARLEDFAAMLRRPENMEHFQELKQDIMAIIREVEGSILYTPQTAKVVPIIIYNLSRFQDNPVYLNEALLNVLVHVKGRENKEHLKELIREYIDSFAGGARNENRSRIMNILADIIGKQDQETDMNSLNGDKIEKIITSLLSSPCNYTPLLHYVIPVVYHGMNIFSELWIDPNDGRESAAGSSDGERSIHILISFDINGIGQFEAELWSKGKGLRINLLCPAEYLNIFQKLTGDFTGIAKEHGYQMEEINIDKMEKVRSLMDVFKDLPYKRTGVDVKI